MVFENKKPLRGNELETVQILQRKILEIGLVDRPTSERLRNLKSVSSNQAFLLIIQSILISHPDAFPERGDYSTTVLTEVGNFFSDLARNGYWELTETTENKNRALLSAGHVQFRRLMEEAARGSLHRAERSIGFYIQTQKRKSQNLAKLRKNKNGNPDDAS